MQNFVNTDENEWEQTERYSFFSFSGCASWILRWMTASERTMDTYTIYPTHIYTDKRAEDNERGIRSKTENTFWSFLWILRSQTIKYNVKNIPAFVFVRILHSWQRQYLHLHFVLCSAERNGDSSKSLIYFWIPFPRYGTISNIHLSIVWWNVRFALNVQEIF